MPLADGTACSTAFHLRSMVCALGESALPEEAHLRRKTGWDFELLHGATAPASETSSQDAWQDGTLIH